MSASPADERDGPGSDPPADVASRPDAEPRLEAIRSGGANKPYQVLGRDYVPLTGDVPVVERGLASWYGRKFHGRPTALGETYDMYAMSAAHPTLPLPSYARIRNPANGREVVVRVNDRGPFHSGRIVDLSYAAAAKLGLLRGVAPVELERITYADIRAGTWRRPGDESTRLAAARQATPAGLTVPSLASVTASAADLAAAESTAGRPSPSLPAASIAESFPAADTGSIGEAAADAQMAANPRGFWVQLGAFRERSGAESLQRRLGGEADSLLPAVVTFMDAALYRVQAGPYGSREQASDAAQRVRDALGLAAVVVERR